MQSEILLQQSVPNTTAVSAYVRPNFGHVHYYMMIYVWVISGNIGLWTMLFKQYKWVNYIHTFFMSLVIVITWMSGFLAIVYYGMHPRIGQVHVGVGMAIMAGVVAQGALGIASWGCQKESKINPYLVYVINLSHRLLGYALYLLALVECLLFLANDKKEQKFFIATLVVSLISYVGFLVLKYFKKSMQSYAALPDHEFKQIPFIRSERDLAYTHGNYFIFSDKVYDVNKIITNHPGGFDVIGHIRKK
jgi:hypothetical protein